MARDLDPLERLALLSTWDERCVWCQTPLFYNDMEVDHLLPKSLEGKDNSALFASHAVSPDFDLFAIENLAPSCGPCNGLKGKKPPPEAPIVATVLQTAAERAPKVRELAEKTRGNRAIERASAVVLAGAKDGNAEALAALSDAARELKLAFREATGVSLSRVHSAFDALTDIGDVLHRTDPHFEYGMVNHPTDAPAYPLLPDTVMSITQVGEGTTSRIDARPRTPEAVEQYGPAFRLSAIEGEVGAQAAAQLRAALAKGEAVTIDEGIELTFERLPPCLDDLVGRPIIGAVSIGPVDGVEKRPIPDWDARLTATAGADTASMRVLLRQVEAPDDWDDSIVGEFGGLIVTALMRWRDDAGEIRWNFKHQRNQAPVRDQLAALGFLEVMSRGGTLTIEDLGPTERDPTTVESKPHALEPGGMALLSFLSDVRVIEEWTGVEFELPDQITREEIGHIVVLAGIIRAGGRLITWNNASFTIDEASLKDLQTGAAFKAVHQVSAFVLGREVELGSVSMELPEYRIADVQPSSEGDSRVSVQIEPKDAAAAEVFEVLIRPGEDPASVSSTGPIGPKKPARRPPPPPRKVLAARKKAKANKKHGKPIGR